jgi:hypothetical protein
MVILAFPNAKQPTNTENKVEFSQLQVEDQNLSLIQDNISEYTENLSKMLTQKDNYRLLAQNNRVISLITPSPLTLQATVKDEYHTYNVTSGVFTAPQDAVYEVVVYGVATPFGGAPTALFVDIQPSLGDLTSQGIAILTGKFYIDVVIPFGLTKGSTLKFAVRTDVLCTLDLDATLRISITW